MLNISKPQLLSSLLICLSLFFCTSCSNQKIDKWQANWIWTSEKGPNNVWVNFRKKVILSNKPESAVTRIASENKYWLYINDSLVLRDGGLDTRPDLNNTYYDNVDLAPYLRKGENTICALVWHKGGPDGYTQRSLDKGGFLFESHIDGAQPAFILSDSSWKVRVDSAFVRGVFQYKYGKTGTVTFDVESFGQDLLEGVEKEGFYRPSGSVSPFIRCASEGESFTLPGKCDIAFGSTEGPARIWNSYKWLAYPVTFDARLATDNWTIPGYDDTRWVNATEKGVPPIDPWNKLMPRTIPFWKDYGLASYKNDGKWPTLITSDTIINCLLDKNIQGTPYFKIKAPAGVAIRIQLNDFYHQDYITREGEQEFECYAWQNSSKHYVQYRFENVSDPVQIIDLKFRQTGYNAKVIGTFNSSDTALNQLWEKCKNTSYVCMRDYFYDCPDRERGQWWGDVSEQILYSFYLYDQSANLLAKKAFRELLYSQKDDGSLYTTAPGKEFTLPDQNLAAVNMLWNYYLYTGDKELLEELYPKVRSYINYLVTTTNHDGMIVMQDSVWNWIDWGNNMDVQTGSVNAVCNALYASLLGNIMKVADVVGQNSDAKLYRQLHDKVKQSYNNYFWNGNAYAFHNMDGKQSLVVDDRTNAWAVLAGMVDSTKTEKILELLKSRYNASPYQEMYVELAMFRLDPEATLLRLRNRYDAMIKSWSSTLWEEFPAKNSNNHAWSAGPLYLLSAYYLGVKPTKPAYAEFEFFPALGGLDSLSGIIPSPLGQIQASCKYDRENHSLKQNLTVPPKAVAFVGIPKNISGKRMVPGQIYAQSKLIWKDGVNVQKLKNIEFVGERQDYIVFKVKTGETGFTIEYGGSR